MHVRRVFIGSITALFIVSSAVISAQSLTQTIELSDRVQVRLPEDWEQFEGDNSYVGDSIGMFFYEPDYLVDFTGEDDLETPEDALRALYDAVRIGDRPAARNIDALDIDGRDAAVYATDDEFDDGSPLGLQYYGVTLSDKSIAAALVFGVPDAIEDEADLLADILESFDIAPSILRDEQTQAGDSQPCVVSVATADTGRLRVGPGENRSAVAFLPIGDEYTVLGRLEADDGSVWYQLDKDEAAPTSAANEIWIAADDVESTGDCDLVGDASAPPIVPITQGGAAGGEGDAAPPAPETITGAIPVSGTYRFQFDSTLADASCAGTGNVQIPVAELYEGQSSGYITVLDGGARLDYSGDIWTRAADGRAFYTGDIAFAPGSAVPNGVVYLNVISSTLLRGTLVSNFTIDGVGCSTTVAVTVRR